MVFASLKQVFQKKSYTAIAVLIAIFLFVLIVWLPNISLVFDTIFSDNFTFTTKFNILFGLLSSIYTNFNLFSGLSTVTISILFGVDLALLVFYVRNRAGSIKGKSFLSSISGLFAGGLGIGCATCGTLVFGPLLSTIGAGSLILFLPFKGQELSLIGILVLTYSIFSLSKKLQEPVVCKLK